MIESSAMRRLIALAASGAAFLLLAAGGVTAQAPAAAAVRLGIPGRLNSGASVAADGARVVVTWAATSDTGSDVYAAFSDDGGASFGAPARVNDVAGDARMSGEQPPRVALGQGIKVAWLSRQGSSSVIRLATAAPGGHTFGPAATIHAGGLKGARGWQSLAVDREGAAHVAWLDGRGDASGPTARPATAGAPAGKGMRQDVFQAVVLADGSRRESRLATDVCFCCKTAVATGADGSVYVAWRHIYPPNIRDIAIARSTDGGKTFGPPARVSEDGWAIDGCPDDGPALAVDARGTVHIVWPTLVSAAAGKGIFYSWSPDGRTFAPRVRLDEGAGGAAHPQLAVDGDRVVAAWEQTTGNGPRAFLRAIAGVPRGASGAPALTPVSVLGDDGSSYPALAAAGDAVVAAWTEETAGGSTIRVRRLGR